MSSLLFSLIANRAREILNDCQLAKKNECTTSQGGEKANFSGSHTFSLTATAKIGPLFSFRHARRNVIFKAKRK